MTMKNRLKENIFEYGILFFKGKNFILTHVNNSYHTFKKEIKKFLHQFQLKFIFLKKSNIIQKWSKREKSPKSRQIMTAETPRLKTWEREKGA